MSASPVGGSSGDQPKAAAWMSLGAEMSPPSVTMSRDDRLIGRCRVETPAGGHEQPLTARELAVSRRMRAVAPAAAKMFLDACELKAGRHRLASVALLTAHLVREIESTLTGMLDPKGGRDRQANKELQAELADAHGVEQREFAERLKRFKARVEREGLEGKYTRIADALGVAADEDWIMRLRSREKLGLEPPAWAHHDHGPDALREPGDVFDEFWELHLAAFEDLIDLFERTASALLRRVEELLGSGPEGVDLAALGRLPRSPFVLNHLFSEAADPTWVPTFDRAGLFENPPDAEADVETGVLTPVGWPQGAFLVRMAAIPAAQAAVASILLRLETTTNPIVERTVVEAASLLPGELSKHLASRVAEAIDAGVGIHAGIEAGRLAARLAAETETDAAFTLAAHVLEIQPTEDTLGAPRPHGRLGTWEYGEAAKLIVPALLDAEPLRGLQFTLDLLDRAIGFGLTETMEGRDLSEYWRPTIEDSAHNHEDRDVRQPLVSSLRDALAAEVGDGILDVKAVCDELDKRQWTLMHRFKLWLLARFPDRALETAVSEAFDLELAETLEEHYEHARLLSVVFPMADDDRRATYLRWVEAGPDTDDYTTRYAEHFKHPPDDETTRGYVERWQIERLFPVGECLDAEWLARYEELSARHGERVWDDYVEFKVVTKWGDKTPMSISALKAMTPEAIADYLRTWEPPGTFDGPTVRGMSHELRALVAEEPERFAPATRVFLGLRQEYVDAVLYGLQEAVRQNRPFAWEAVVDFMMTCSRTKAYVRTDTERSEGDETLDAIASLLRDGLSISERGVPPELLETAWLALEPVLADVNPTPEHEAKYGGTNMDPLTLSLNVVRGMGIHAAIALARAFWLRTGEDQLPWEEREGLAAFEPLADALVKHLDPVYESSLAVRAAYGWSLRLLCQIDPGWVRRNMPALLPPDDPARRFVVFDAYLVTGNVSEASFGLLADEYRFRVSVLGDPSPVLWERRDPESALAQHLTLLVFHEAIALEDEVVAAFYEKADDELRAEATGHVARLIGDMKKRGGEPTRRQLDIAIAMWESRLEAARSAQARGDIASYRGELTTFGYWYTSEAFDEDWALANLEAVLSLNGWVEPDHSVMEQLASQAKTHPAEAVRCAQLMSLGDPEGWGPHSWREDLAVLFENALASENDAAISLARELANRLLYRGFEDYRRFAE